MCCELEDKNYPSYNDIKSSWCNEAINSIEKFQKFKVDKIIPSDMQNHLLKILKEFHNLIPDSLNEALETVKKALMQFKIDNIFYFDYLTYGEKEKYRYKFNKDIWIRINLIGYIEYCIEYVDKIIYCENID